MANACCKNQHPSLRFTIFPRDLGTEIAHLFTEVVISSSRSHRDCSRARPSRRRRWHARARPGPMSGFIRRLSPIPRNRSANKDLEQAMAAAALVEGSEDLDAVTDEVLAAEDRAAPSVEGLRLERPDMRGGGGLVANGCKSTSTAYLYLYSREDR